VKGLENIENNLSEFEIQKDSFGMMNMKNNTSTSSLHKTNGNNMMLPE
jgi:hypothetical protein